MMMPTIEDVLLIENTAYTLALDWLVHQLSPVITQSRRVNHQRRTDISKAIYVSLYDVMTR